MSEIDDGELAAWLAQVSPGGIGGIRVLVSYPDGFEATWDVELLDRDIRAVAAEHLALAEREARGFRRGGPDLTAIKDLASSQPKEYAAFVIESAIALLSKYALHAAPQRVARQLTEGLFWMIMLARQEHVIDEPEVAGG